MSDTSITGLYRNCETNLAIPWIHSALRQTRLVDAEAVGGVYVVQKGSRLINYEEDYCHIECCRLLHSAYSH